MRGGGELRCQDEHTGTGILFGFDQQGRVMGQLNSTEGCNISLPCNLPVLTKKRCLSTKCIVITK